MPSLILPAVQVNIRTGEFPEREGRRDHVSAEMFFDSVGSVAAQARRQ
jgi:hypothetical protein